MEVNPEKVNLAKAYRSCCERYKWTYSTKGFVCFCALWGLRKRWRR